MSTRVLGLALVFAVLTMAMPAQGHLSLQTAEQVKGYAVRAQHQLASPGTVVYSNISNGPTGGYSQAYPPASEIGDELLMTAGGILDSVDFSVYNGASSAGPLQTADLILNFYNQVGVSFVWAGGLTFNGVDFGVGGLPAGYFSTFSLSNISAVSTITLTNDVLATLTISNLGGGANRVGQVLMNPPTVGSSTDDFYKDGLWYWFGGNPVANFYWQIDVVPEPATLSLLALGGLAMMRRRR